MPVQPGELDDLQLRVRLAYEKAWQRVKDEQDLIASDPKRYARQRRLQEVERNISLMMGDLDDEALEYASKQIPRALLLGGESGAAAAGTAAGGEAGSFVFSLIAEEAVEEIAGNLVQELLSATKGVKESTKQLIREVARNEQLQSLIAGGTATDAAKAMRQILGTHGITAVTYANGAKHGLREYAHMAVRTQTGIAYNHGTILGATGEGVKFFECFDGPDCGWQAHEDPTKAMGRLVERDEALGNPISHPNCRRAFGPRPDVTTKKDAERINKSGKSSVTEEQIEAQRLQDQARLAAQQRRSARARQRKPSKSQLPSPAQQRATSRADAAARRARRTGQQAEPELLPLPDLDALSVPKDSSGIINGVDYYKDVESVESLINKGYSPGDAVKEHKRQKANAASKASRARKKLKEGGVDTPESKSWVDQLKAENVPGQNPKIIYGHEATGFPTTGQVGGVENDIATHFVADTPSGSYVYIDNVRLPAHLGASVGKPTYMRSGIAVKRNGTVYIMETTPGEPITDAIKHELEKRVATAEGTLQSIPSQWKPLQKDMYFMRQANPDDAYWAKKYNMPGFKSGATGGNGSTFIWDAGKVDAGTILHEFGHTFDNKLAGKDRFWTRDSMQWSAAVGTGDLTDVKLGDAVFKFGDVTPPKPWHRTIRTGGPGVSDYGATNLQEDFAESVRLYFQDRYDGKLGTLSDGTEVRFVDVFPNRAALLDQHFGLQSPTDTTFRVQARLKARTKLEEFLDEDTGEFAGDFYTVSREVAAATGIPSSSEMDDLLEAAITHKKAQIAAAKAAPKIPDPQPLVTSGTKADLPKNVQASIASKKSKYKKSLIDQGTDPQTATKMANDLEAIEVDKRLRELGIGKAGAVPAQVSTPGGAQWKPGINEAARKRGKAWLTQAGKTAADPDKITAKNLVSGPKKLTPNELLAKYGVNPTGSSYRHIVETEELFDANGKLVGLIHQTVQVTQPSGHKLIGSERYSWQSAFNTSNPPHNLGFVQGSYKTAGGAKKNIVDQINFQTAKAKGVSLASTKPAGAAKDAIGEDIAKRLNNREDWDIFREYMIRTSGSPGQQARSAVQAIDPGPFDNPTAYDQSRAGHWFAPKGGPASTPEEMRQQWLYGEASMRVQKWAGTSGDNDVHAVAMQRAIKEEFKTTGDYYVRGSQGRGGATLQQIDEFYSKGGSFYRRFARRMYENTQEQLAADGITEVSLYRGMNFGNGRPAWAASGRNSRAELQPANSWSTDRSVSVRFGRTLFQATVPRERILGSARTGFGCLNEKEFVVLDTEGLSEVLQV